jgi:two-component system, sensor histidine kinase and response regulator
MTVNDILDFSKIEAGKLPLEQEDFDLRAMVEDMNDLLALKAQQKGVEYVCCIDPKVPVRLKGDAGRLRQLLTNVIGNAVKFTEAGEIAIDAYLADQVDQRLTLGFTVSDTGPGIPQDRLDSIFQEFSQVDAGMARRFGGTGLGLTIAKRLVTKMGGEITVESPAATSSAERPASAGPGTTFRVTVVLERSLDLAPDRSRVAPVDLRDQRVLVVDDNATNRRLLSVLLESWDCRHEEVAGADEAFARLKQAVGEGDPFRVAILDMHMPGTDGETLGRKIKRDAELAGTTMLVMATSVGMRGDAVRLKDIGFAAYLTKPIRQSRLYDCLATILNEARGQEGGGWQGKRLVTQHTLPNREERRVRILLAEDNVVNQKVAVRILQKLGYRADVVANGCEVLVALERMPYDAVLMDCQMPEMDGYEATRRVRETEEAASAAGGAREASTPGARVPRIPIIAMTAHALKGDRQKCLDAGMDDYVTKPVNPQALSEALERWLSA